MLWTGEANVVGAAEGEVCTRHGADAVNGGAPHKIAPADDPSDQGRKNHGLFMGSQHVVELPRSARSHVLGLLPGLREGCLCHVAVSAVSQHGERSTPSQSLQAW